MTATRAKVLAAIAALSTLRDAAIAWAERITDPIGIWGDDTDQALLDAAVALGAKYTPAATA